MSPFLDLVLQRSSVEADFFLYFLLLSWERFFKFTKIEDSLIFSFLTICSSEAEELAGRIQLCSVSHSAEFQQG